MTDIVTIGLLYVGAALIINPPVVGGKVLPPAPDANGDIAYTFTQPLTPCSGPDCQQEIVRMEEDPRACWIYEIMRLDNVEKAPSKFRIERAPGTVQFLAIGDVSGRVFRFRAHVTSRCAPAA
jgi:hypothetical protein